MKDELPIGWAEIDLPPNPLDVGTPDDEWKTTATPRRARKQILCWVRGGRYVRVCEVREPKDDEWRYALRPHFCIRLTQTPFVRYNPNQEATGATASQRNWVVKGV